jgi:hypothetical protein
VAPPSFGHYFRSANVVYNNLTTVSKTPSSQEAKKLTQGKTISFFMKGKLQGLANQLVMSRYFPTTTTTTLPYTILYYYYYYITLHYSILLLLLLLLRYFTNIISTTNLY